MSFSEKEKQNILQPLQELLKAKCLMQIQSKQMEQNVFANWIIRPKTISITLFYGTQKENF